MTSIWYLCDKISYVYYNTVEYIIRTQRFVINTIRVSTINSIQNAYLFISVWWVFCRISFVERCIQVPIIRLILFTYAFITANRSKFEYIIILDCLTPSLYVYNMELLLFVRFHIPPRQVNIIEMFA